MSVSGRRNNSKIIPEAKGIHPYFSIGEVFYFTDPTNGEKYLLEVGDARQFPSGLECEYCKLKSLCRKAYVSLDNVPQCISSFRVDRNNVYFK
jgi:hypothetical protein